MKVIIDLSTPLLKDLLEYSTQLRDKDGGDLMTLEETISFMLHTHLAICKDSNE